MNGAKILKLKKVSLVNLITKVKKFFEIFIFSLTTCMYSPIGNFGCRHYPLHLNNHLFYKKFRSSTEKLKNERLYRSCEFCYWKECFRIWMSDLPRFPKNGHQGKLEKIWTYRECLDSQSFQILFSNFIF